MNYINDIPLYNKDEGNVNLVIEICPGTNNKNEFKEPGFEDLICVRQVEGEYPFYYGSFPQTYAGDKDPLDFILFTDIKHNLLDVVKADVIGAVKTLDAGEQDDKIICVETSCKLKNLKAQMKKALKFLKSYKGKDADMIIEENLATMEEAERLVDYAHRSWRANNRIATVKIAGKSSKGNNSRIRIIRG